MKDEVIFYENNESRIKQQDTCTCRAIPGNKLSEAKRRNVSEHDREKETTGGLILKTIKK